MNVLVTGGTGSFGQECIGSLLSDPANHRVVVFSRDELKQHEMRNEYPEDRYPQVRYFLGDVRDLERLAEAFRGIDVVIHAAALKQVPALEYNPIEAIQTNVIGAQNVIRAAIRCDVKKVIALSSDKAAAPVNLYGATKLCADKLFAAATSLSGGTTRFATVRYGNVAGSRGSVIPLWLAQAGNGQMLSVTNPDMTRFSILLPEAVQFVRAAIREMSGGEMFVPKLSAYRLGDLADVIAGEGNWNVTGVRPGEKVHETMVPEDEAGNAYDLSWCWQILPAWRRPSGYKGIDPDAFKSNHAPRMDRAALEALAAYVESSCV